MKRIVLALCLVASFVSAAQAQSSAGPIVRRNLTPPISGHSVNVDDPGDLLPENYILSLTVTDKGKPATELTLVIATSQFSADAAEFTLNMSGTAAQQDDGSILVRYSFAEQIAVSVQNGLPVVPEATTTSIQYKTRSVRSAVRLRVGEPVVVLKDGSRVYQLSISRLNEGSKKDK
jgi:hypothetical protein